MFICSFQTSTSKPYRYGPSHCFAFVLFLGLFVNTFFGCCCSLVVVFLCECLSPRKKTTIEEQWEQNGAFELISVEQETYEKYFFGCEHWNYFTSDEDLGPVILSIKQETLNGRDQFRILVRAGSYTVHGLIPASCVFADRWVSLYGIWEKRSWNICFPIYRYNREEVVRSLGKEVNLNPPLTLGQLPDTPEELLKLDQVIFLF